MNMDSRDVNLHLDVGVEIVGGSFFYEFDYASHDWVQADSVVGDYAWTSFKRQAPYQK